MFNSDWACHPGSTVEELREEKGISGESLASLLGLSAGELALLEQGNKDIDPHLAEQLELAFGIPERFWLTMQNNYYDDLKRIKVWNH